MDITSYEQKTLFAFCQKNQKCSLCKKFSWFNYNDSINTILFFFRNEEDTNQLLFVVYSCSMFVLLMLLLLLLIWFLDKFCMCCCPSLSTVKEDESWMVRLGDGRFRPPPSYTTVIKQEDKELPSYRDAVETPCATQQLQGLPTATTTVNNNNKSYTHMQRPLQRVDTLLLKQVGLLPPDYPTDLHRSNAVQKNINNNSSSNKIDKNATNNITAQSITPRKLVAVIKKLFGIREVTVETTVVAV